MLTIWTDRFSQKLTNVVRVQGYNVIYTGMFTFTNMGFTTIFITVPFVPFRSFP